MFREYPLLYSINNTQTLADEVRIARLAASGHTCYKRKMNGD